MPNSLPPLLIVGPKPHHHHAPPDPRREDVFRMREDVQKLYLDAGRLQLSLPLVPSNLSPHDSLTLFHEHRPCKLLLGDLTEMMFHAFFSMLRHHPDEMRQLVELVSQRLNISLLATKDEVVQAIADVYENLDRKSVV